MTSADAVSRSGRETPEVNNESRLMTSAEPIYGMCLACRAVEVKLDNVVGYRDFSSIGEHERYPVGHGCEACS